MNKFDKIYKFKYSDPKTRIITKCDARNSLRYGKFISIMKILKILKILKSKIGNKKILFEINDNELFYDIAIKRKDYWKKKIKYKKVDIMENLNYQLSESCIEIEEVINEKNTGNRSKTKI